jgi:hypothetical protein
MKFFEEPTKVAHDKLDNQRIRSYSMKVETIG